MGGRWEVNHQVDGRFIDQVDVRLMGGRWEVDGR